MSKPMQFFSTTRSAPVALGAALLLLATVVPPSQAQLGSRSPDERRYTLNIPHGLRHADDLHSIEVERGKTILLRTAFGVSRLAIGDPAIADFVAISDREIEIIAKKVGDTNLLIWGEGRFQAIVDINVGTLQPRMVRELRRLLKNPDIEVDVAGGSIILRGYVPTLQAFEQAGLVASAYVNRAQKSIAGETPSQAPSVINLLEVGGKHQVMIEVVIAELSRDMRRALGVNIMGKATSGGTQAATFQSMLKNLSTYQSPITTPGSSGGVAAISDTVTLAGSYFQSESMDLRIFLEAVEASQLGTILARPTLVARSGQTASFLVGGEVPIPLVTSFGAQATVLFKKFGVNVEFTPTVLAPDRIHLQITPEVSEPDYTLAVRVLGSAVPAFRTRRVTTSVELGDGESFVLAGLLREDIRGETENVPFLSNVPLLGQFFRTRSYQKTETELVLIATPHLVQPIEPGTKIALPTDHFIEPTLSEFYWDGRIEGRAPFSAEDEKKQDHSSALDEGSENASLAREAADYSDDAMTEVAVGGFMGPTGYRIEAPKPTGGIQ